MKKAVIVHYCWVKEQCSLAHVLIQLSHDGFVPEEVRQCIENANIIEATTTYLVVASEGRRYLFYKDINWEKPLVPTRMLKKVGRKVSLGYAILDLLAESSLYALYMSDVLDLIRLQNMYPSSNFVDLVTLVFDLVHPVPVVAVYQSVQDILICFGVLMP